MLVSDLLHSCANERVAEAAVASIGGALLEKLRAEADERGISVGLLASNLVRGFARHASERDWRELVDAVRGQDLPVLCGLQIILSKPIPDGSADRRSETRGGVRPLPGSRKHAASLSFQAL